MKSACKASVAALASGFVFCLALGSANAGPVPAFAGGDIARGGVASLIEDVQFQPRRMGPRVVPRGGPRVVGRRGFGGRALGAGIAAGVLGAIVGGALMNQPQPRYVQPGEMYVPPPPPDPVYVAPRRGGAVEWCMQRYRSYNPNTGTYVGFDGIERPCP